MNGPLTLAHYMVLAGLLFLIGIFGALTRRNIIGILSGAADQAQVLEARHRTADVGTAIGSNIAVHFGRSAPFAARAQVVEDLQPQDERRLRRQGGAIQRRLAHCARQLGDLRRRPQLRRPPAHRRPCSAIRAIPSGLPTFGAGGRWLHGGNFLRLPKGPDPTGGKIRASLEVQLRNYATGEIFAVSVKKDILFPGPYEPLGGGK